MPDFKLLALRPLKGCSKSILKILNEDEFYFFDNGYRASSDGEYITLNTDRNQEYIPNNFFYKPKDDRSSLQHINIQALVGKNGEGKSSLIELALRIFNNFFKAQKVHEVTKGLIYVKDLNAQLFFSIDDLVYRMSVHVGDIDEPTGVLEYIDEYNVLRDAADVIEKLFFVIDVNYSHYSLNSNDFHSENLATDRYSQLSSWLDSLFHKNDGYQTPLTIHPFRTEGNIDINNEKNLINQRLTNLILTEASYEKINEDLKVEAIRFEKFENDPLWNEFIKIVKLHEKKKPDESDQVAVDMLDHSIITNPQANKYFISKLTSFIDDWVPQLARDFNGDGSDAFSSSNQTEREKIILFLSWVDREGRSEIMKLALMCREILYRFQDIVPSGRLNELLFQYLAVKAKKILRYPIYKDIEKMISLNKGSIATEKYIDGLLNDSSHISLKFNQVYHLLNLTKQRPNCGLVLFYEKFITEDKNSVVKPLSEFKQLIADAMALVEPPLAKIYLNPPGIFKTAVELKSEATNTEVDLKYISSGEYQKVGLISSIIYHLKNIDTIQEGTYGKANRYDKVLLILDEIELYFHPEFQRTLLNDLIQKISEVNFKQVKAVNILFVTHSPFILSDIPKRNVMFIEGGSQTYPMTENTFGANIHTLLQHGFFLKGVPIGEFARNKINELFRVLHNNIDVSTQTDIEQKILMVSEPFLKSQLLKLYNERSSTKTIETLLQKINDLERRINDSDR